MSFSWEEQSTRARRAAVAVDSSSSSCSQLAGGRAVAVARLISLAPVGAGLTPVRATAVLAANGWSLRLALEAVARDIAAVDPTALQPVPKHCMGSAMRNLTNAGNSCYLDAVLAALFATWDAWDGLLCSNVPHTYCQATEPGRLISPRNALTRFASTANSISDTLRGGAPSRESQRNTHHVQHLRATVREAVNRIRKGDPVSAVVVEAVRSALRAAGFETRRGQEDAAELFAYLVDSLGAPFLALGETLMHPQPSSATDDERMATERILWLSLPTGSGDDVRFKSLLNDYFFGNKLDGLRRNATVVSAWKARMLLPWYTPVRETGEVSAINDETSFRALPIPFALKRYSANGQKTRVPVQLPTRIDFTDFVDGVHVGAYSLVLRSVVCHLGNSVHSGHYVTYTYDAFAEPYRTWRRWNDLSPGIVPEVAEDQLEPAAREEIARDSYLVFYELVPGDGLADPRDTFLHVRDVDPLALADDDRTFAQALQRIEFDEFAAAANQCHVQ